MEKYSKLIDIDPETVPITEKKSMKLDAYQGKKVKIARFEIREEINFYPDGKNYDADSTEKCFKIYIYSEPLRALDEQENFTDEILQIPQEDGSFKQVIVHSRFGLNTGEDGKPEISKHPKGKLWQAMRKVGATKLNELIGKTVILDLEASNVEGDDRKYLRLVL